MPQCYLTCYRLFFFFSERFLLLSFCFARLFSISDAGFLRPLFHTLFLFPHPHACAFYFASVTNHHHNNQNFNSVFFYLFFLSFYVSTRLSHGHMTSETHPLPQFLAIYLYYFSFSWLWQFNFVFRNFFPYFHPSRPYSHSLLINLTHFTVWFSYFHIPSFLYSSSFSLTHLLSFYLHLLPHISPLWLYIHSVIVSFSVA